MGGIPRRLQRGLLLAALPFAAWACNAIIGADAPKLREDDASTSPSCTTSDCGADASVHRNEAKADARPPDTSLNGFDARSLTEDASQDSIDVATPVSTDADAGADANAGDSSACTPGARECNGQQPQVCNAGLWKDDGPLCTTACAGGACGLCSANATQCDPAHPNSIQVCSGSGQWGASQPCAYVCTGGKCGGACTPGDKQCNSAVPLTCGNDGQWASGTACPNVCSAGACVGSCTPTTKECSINTPEACSENGTWVDGTPCPYLCSGGACTGVCVPNDTRCSSGTQQQTCNASGLWAAATTCPYVCTGKTCGGICAPGDTQCSSGTQQQICDSSGQWGSAAPCTYVCTGNACGGVCTPADARCTSTTQTEVCATNGTWGSATTCMYACVNKSCGGSCTPGDARCNVNTIQNCSATGSWTDQTACTGATPLCRSNACAAGMPYDYGQPTALPNADTESANTLTLAPITIGYRTSILRFGVAGRQNTGANVVLAIYADSVTSPGSPGTLVATSVPVTVTDGAVESAPTAAANVAAGDYWIGGVYSSTADTWFKNTGGPNAYQVPDTYPMVPATFPTSTPIGGYTLNYYIVVQDY